MESANLSFKNSSAELQISMRQIDGQLLTEIEVWMMPRKKGGGGEREGEAETAISWLMNKTKAFKIYYG